MKFLDRVLQRWRIAKASPYIASGACVLDVGASDGSLFQALPRIGEYVGIDPDLGEEVIEARFKLLRGIFPDRLADDQRKFDVITMLAVLEHIPPPQAAELGKACAQYLKPGGKLVITVPSPFVDHILALLRFLRLIDGMALHEHFGFKPETTPSIFSPPLILERATTFQLGLNYLFVFSAPLASGGTSTESD